VKKLFDVIAPKLKDRQGGYTRVYKMGWRHGDGAPLSLVELLTFAHPGEKKKSPVTKAKEVLGKVTPKKKGKEERKEKKEEEKEKGKGKPKEKEKKEKKVRRRKRSPQREKGRNRRKNFRRKEEIKILFRMIRSPVFNEYRAFFL